MKTRILGMLLCLLCLPGCGDKAQKSHKTAGSVQQEQADTMTLGTSGFPKEIKKAWRVSLQDSMVYVTLMNTAEDGRELQMPYGVFPCEVFHYGNGRWKNVTTQLAPSEQHYKKKEASTSYPFDFLRESAPDDPSHIYPIPKAGDGTYGIQFGGTHTNHSSERNGTLFFSALQRHDRFDRKRAVPPYLLYRRKALPHRLRTLS